MPDVLEQDQERQQPPVEQPEDDAVEIAFVKQWCKRVKADKDYWEKDFKRMRENQEFVSGIQWEGQMAMKDAEGRYTINLIVGIVNGIVAQLYARNPEAEVTPRKRMLYAIWDGSIEMLMEAMPGYMMNRQAGMLVDPMGEMVMQDFFRGKMIMKQVEKVCETLQRLFQFFVDTTKPDFKEQMKQLVVRVVTCGVGYCIPAFVREARKAPSSTEGDESIVDRVKMAKMIMEQLEEDKIREDDPKIETLRTLLLSVGHNQQQGYEEINERLEFDFPPATAIIPDKRCRNLRAFIGARYVTHEMIMPVDEINSFFELSGDAEVKLTGEMKNYNPDGTPVTNPDPQLDNKDDTAKQPQAALWRVFDSQTKSDFFIVDGHKKFVRAPAPLEPSVAGFWHIFSLIFNSIELESEGKVSPYPPSIVDIVQDAQKEWNRTRDALRGQRNANAPTYLVRKGVLTDADKEAIRNREPNQVVELEGVPADREPAQVVQVLQVAQIDKNVYDVDPLEQDIQLGGGVQQANIGPAQPDVTATVGNIAEQSRLQLSSSNVDDIDGFLSAVTRASIEMLIQKMSEEQAKLLIGDGAVLPQEPETRREYLQMIDASIKAASSGRPNQALKVSMRQQLVPLLMQAGANPIAVIEELVKTMDDTLDVQKFFPVPGQAMMTSMPGQPQQKPQQPQVAGPQQTGPVGPSEPQQAPPNNVMPMPTAQPAIG